MTSQQVFRDMTDIYSRLFNHKAALQGLNQNFVREFEEKGEETLSLSRIQEWLDECSQKHFPATQDILASHTHLVKDAVEAATKSCQKILQDETEKESSWLEEERARRAQAWDQFMQGQVTTTKQRTDADFDLRAEGLRRHYADLEEKLSQGPANRAL